MATGKGWFIGKLLLGPLTFLLVLSVEMGALPEAGRWVLATFLWAAVWWVVQPIPWAITSLLPLVIFPLAGIMRIGPTVSLYGQNIFFWIFGTVMLGYAMEKHGLARRFALRFLSIRGVASTTSRLAFMYMCATAVVSMFVSDAAAVAMMIPIGMSMVSYLRELRRDEREGRSALAAFLALGSLCAAEAGGMGTLVGLPHNALAVSLLEKLTGRSLGWFEWMMVGLPLAVLVLISYYWVLHFYFPPEFSEIPGGEEFLRRETEKLGSMSRGEVNVVVVFVLMVILFMAPSLSVLILGETHPLAMMLDEKLPIWVVPPIVLFLLFLLPVDLEKGETTLVWKDAVQHAPWNIMMLCAGAVAMTDALTEFGFMEFMQGHLQEIGVNRYLLPYAVAAVVGLSTNVISGLAATSLFCNIFIPMAVEIGFNPASMAMLIPNNGLGIVFPWAGAAAGTAFATGYLELKDMLRVGIACTIILALATATLHLLFSPFL